MKLEPVTVKIRHPGDGEERTREGGGRREREGRKLRAAPMFAEVADGGEAYGTRRGCSRENRSEDSSRGRGVHPPRPLA